MPQGRPFSSATEAPAALAELCRRFHVQKLEVFGSTATGNGFEPGRSDLDLLVEFEPLEPGQYARSYFGLLEALKSLSGGHVDLLTERSIENPYLRRCIDSERRLLFSAS